jgi:hypothetical protein
MLCISTATFAQSNDQFIGTWNLSISDTPQGNINVELSIERVDGKLNAKFSQVGTSQATSISNITEKENEITMYFFAEGYDLYLRLNSTEDDKISGYLIDQFPVKGERAK